MEPRQPTQEDSAAASAVIATFHRIGSLQHDKLFLVIAFYVESSLIPVLQPYLKEDVPPIGASGRFHGVPVFAKDSTHNADLERRSEGIVEYTYMNVLSID